MEFKEAYDKANDGDVIKSGASEIIKGERERLVNLSLFLQVDWQIIPSKKEMIGPNEWKFQKKVREHVGLGNLSGDEIYRQVSEYARLAWQASAENRDILYADLMKKQDAYFKTQSGAALHELKMAATRVKSVLNPTATHE